MKIQKYRASNEKEAMMMVKAELGKDALILSIKSIKPKGIFKFFRKPSVEVVAALDEKKQPYELKRENENKDSNEHFNQKVEQIEKLLRSKLGDGPIPHQPPVRPSEAEGNTSATAVMEAPSEESVISLIYHQLIAQELTEKTVNKLTYGLHDVHAESEDIQEIVSIVYQRIVKELGLIHPIKETEHKPETVFFVGPTGVGKTTTIAKLASYFVLNLNKKVALITADTYRIAAVEQLKTYASILNIPIEVIYSPDEIEESLERLKDYEFVFIDTAGRSHKNEEQQTELIDMLGRVPKRKVYLVLSLTAKLNDMVTIASTYKKITDFDMILTKLDETECYGNILNVRLETGAALSYVTYGQKVPDDFSELNHNEIAKSLMGGHEI